MGQQVLLTVKPADRADIVLQWVKDGLTRCEDIAAEMNVTKGTISKLATELIKNGLLKKNGREYVAV